MTVAIVGAGLAGLTAATELAALGIDVVVFEARDRVGGRTHGVEVAPGQWADAGAAYLGSRHTELTALISRLGLATTPTSTEGQSRFSLRDGDPVTTDGRFPPVSAVALGELFDLLDEVTAAIRPDAPWESANAAALDAETVTEWVERSVRHADARLFFPLFLGEMMAADPDDISVLHMGFYLASGGGLQFLNAFEGGAQESRVDGGAHQIGELLAAKLGDRLRLSETVRSIAETDASVVLTTDGGTWDAEAVVVAIPPLLADAIEFHPAPPARSGSGVAPGCAIKVQLVYPSPLWRAEGLSGWSVSADGPLLSTVDDSPPGGVGVLTGFVTGAEAKRFGALTADRQRARVLAQTRRLFPSLPDPIGYHRTDWLNDPHSRGCYAALFGPGDWVATGPTLTTPHGRVHWAGTETSTEFFGLMEGAIRSGRRAAAEIAGTR
ncbi:flavin monoamine oxidase family protein [Actinokineospora inagensis]|uniref:flavin monoamine oxidase family protein n=1 Tax=Actinokineospora inagensis TaxID=103730 RepID=UPI0004032871|nr:FAD-dependent oxidoreductase [Actinokineospora inagensis]